VTASVPEVTLPQIPGVESLLRVTVSLTLVILAIVLAAWLLRRMTRAQALNGTGLRVIGGLAVGSRERVVLIEAGTTRMLLGVAPGQVSTLHVFEQGPGGGGARPAAGAEFVERLDALLQPEKGP
jgi:flagellar protein FliO/FliZ